MLANLPTEVASKNIKVAFVLCESCIVNWRRIGSVFFNFFPAFYTRVKLVHVVWICLRQVLASKNKNKVLIRPSYMLKFRPWLFPNRAYLIPNITTTLQIHHVKVRQNSLIYWIAPVEIKTIIKKSNCAVWSNCNIFPFNFAFFPLFVEMRHQWVRLRSSAKFVWLKFMLGIEH